MSKPTKLLYALETTWEDDIIYYDFLKEVDNVHRVYFNKGNISSFKYDPDYRVILVFTKHHYSVNTVINIAKVIKPDVIFYLSDEGGDIPESVKLGEYCRIVLRQYNHNKYKYPKNSIHIPLAYVTGFTDKQNKIIKKMNERELNASSICIGKSDRFIMRDVFSKMEKTRIEILKHNSWQIDSQNIKPSEMFDIYNNSIFVLCGRGDIVLSCSRIYESIVAGAIPVLVATKEQIEEEFTFNDSVENPFNLLYFKSWDIAFTECNKLLLDIPKLQKLQDSLGHWWNTEISYINKLIK